MTFLSNMKIGSRLTLGFGLLALLFMAMGAVTIWKARAVGQEVHSVIDERYPQVVDLYKLELEVNRQSRFVRNMLIFTNPEAMTLQLRS